ncbi:MAG: sensor histidine kinase [Bacteroidales bacterium]|nr:sensor histidine kinase [Bacteroidales bacterium]
MKKCLFLISLILISASDIYALKNTPEAVRGTLDLTNIETEERFIINLNGEWEFYWNQLLNPSDFNGQNVPKPDIYGRVPSYWTDYRQDSIKPGKYGCATYRLLILLPKGFRKSLAFDMPVFDSSYEIYVDGRLYAENGRSGKSESESVPEYRRNFFRFQPGSDTISVLIHVSNFHHRRGGFWLPVKFGTFNEVQTRLAMSYAAEWATISILIGFSLFFLIFYMLYPREKLLGYFSLTTIGLALRPMVTSHFLVLNFININWDWIVRFEYLGIFIVMTGWTWFSAKLYPSKVIDLTAKILTSLFAAGAVATITTPVKVFSYATLVYYPSVVILLGYVLYFSIKGVLKKHKIDYIYFAAFVFLLAGAVHDIRVSLGKSDTSAGYILSYIVVIFVFIQAALLLYNWVKAFEEKERLHRELEFLNRNLEKMVNDRTSEIKARQTEIENQSRRIALQNKQLSETLQIKNKIFSVIAHDLRSPVVNILYMLNLLKEKEYKDKFDTFANASIQYAQQVISLLENMLVWGRGQEEKIKFSPEKRDLADIILTNLSIFKESADKKQISMNFTQIGNSKAYIDKDLLDIIIRNLLSNAIKYTPRGGRVSILLKDKTLTGNGIMIKVCDNGIGIPPVRQKYLFTTTEMDSTPGTENEKGTGLGLKLCSELVKIHNGTITVESKQGEGTCFIIELPDKE